MKYHTFLYWAELRVGDKFRVPGCDDILEKISETHAKDLGCGWLKRPVKFANKGEIVLMATPGSTASGLILHL